jgi:hypothetical protein
MSYATCERVTFAYAKFAAPVPVLRSVDNAP